MNLFNKKIIFAIILIAFGAAGHVSANSTNVSASETRSSKVVTIDGSIQQDSYQASWQDQTHKQAQLRQQIKPKKNKKFQRTIYPMFP